MSRVANVSTYIDLGESCHQVALSMEGTLAALSDPDRVVDVPGVGALVRLPALFHSDEIGWDVEGVLINPACIVHLHPQILRTDDREDIVCAIGEARRERPEMFDVRPLVHHSVLSQCPPS